MSNFLWVKTPKRQKILDDLEKIPEIGRKNKSVLMEMALEEFLLKHQKSQNPQTTMSLFKQDGVCAIPNMYEANDNPDMWKKFYHNIKSKEEYKVLDKAINIVLVMHNKKDKEFK